MAPSERKSLRLTNIKVLRLTKKKTLKLTIIKTLILTKRMINPFSHPPPSTSTDMQRLRIPGIKISYLDIGPPINTCSSCGASMWLQEKTNPSKNTDYQTFSLCCQDGKVSLPPFRDTPEPLRTLLDYAEPRTSKFRDHIRTYNSIFCFTSFGAKVDHSINVGRAPYTFRISGQNYHRIGSLLPVVGQQPRYAQLYFYDTEHELRNRMSVFPSTDKETDNLHEQIVSDLIDMFNEHSSVAKAFRMARDWCCQHRPNRFELRLLGQHNNARQYSNPTVSEIAVLITDDFGQSTAPRDIIVCQDNSALQRISELHQLYMALQYPILFPYGEPGYHESIPYSTNSGTRKTKRECVTMREYYAYRIQQRRHQGTTLLRGGRLFQQYLVDAYTAVEEQRLRWLRTHQNDLRIDLYNNIYDAVAKGDTRADAIGQRIVLPATFTGGPRYMVQNYQDAMALCRTFGNPDLFITFTANPKWPEIECTLAPIQGQKSHERPDVVTRIFKLKLNRLMDDLMKNEIFGKCHAGVYTIEFQKRGLPHAHILIWLDEADKCKTPDEINDIIQAEIPSKDDDPTAHKVVTDYMLHGPCGIDGVHASCTVDGKCTKRFPRPFYRETTIDEDGYPVYRRRNNKVFVKRGNVRLDNRYVVPYNLFLLSKYEAHINVEWCNRSRAIKYLFKYLNKGPDRATIVIQDNVGSATETTAEKIFKVDEIKNYLDCRYLSPCEAVWRIFAFDIHYAYPSVFKLTFHLPEQNSVTIRDSQDLSSLLRRGDLKTTMFTEWFELNKRDPQARTLTYAEIPGKYVWNDVAKTWKPRKQRKCVGRILYCHPTAGERYFLRLLLTIVRGPDSYEAIRTLNNITYATFKEACYAHGLLNDDKEWTDAILEASTWATGPQLRELFVTILLMCEVSNIQQLWERCWEALSDDILFRKRKHFSFHELQLSNEQLQNYCLVDIEELLHRAGKSLTDYEGLPKPDPILLTQVDNRLIREELKYNVSQLQREHDCLFSQLNPEQLAIYTNVVKSIQEDTGGFFFVYGPGGTGKTFLYKTILSKIRSSGIIALAVASSGIASLLLPGGRTAHSRFVIPLEVMENSTCGIKQNTQLAKLMQEVKLIVWDEAPMTKRHAFEALDKTLRDILGLHNPKNRERVFGGMTILLGGDFRQVLPVIEKGKRQEIVQACINKSDLWKYCKLFSLTRSMRVNEIDDTGNIDISKQTFNRWILEVGDGIAPAMAKESDDEPTWIHIPDQHLIKQSSDPITQIIDEIYPSFLNHREDEDYLRERAILTPKNSDADEINSFMFNMLAGESKTYKSFDELCKASTDNDELDNQYPTEFLNTLTFPGMPPHSLQLKEGLPVMLLRNVNPAEGLCNGTRLIITFMGRFVIKARIITGSKIGNTALIPRIFLTSTRSKWPFIMKRRQFPIKPCYAMTINKSQGQSLNYVGVYLPNPVFTHGQLYVAISRVTNPEGLKILMLNDATVNFENRTRNIVYKEVFNNLLCNEENATSSSP